MKSDVFARAACVGLSVVALVAPAAAEQAASRPPSAQATTTPAAANLPEGYVIGAEDVLTVTFWRDKELSGDAVVRPDGKISLPLLNDVQAAGYTPEQLAGVVKEAASKYIADPEATVIVKEIRSRKVSVLGEVSKQGTIPLTRDMNVLELIAEAGGLLEYADRENIVIIRKENGRERRLKFNYDDVIKGRNVQQNVVMQPGDILLVP